MNTDLFFFFSLHRYKTGDSFFHLSLLRAQKTLEKDNAAIDERVSKLEAKKRECEEGMRDLKVHLYVFIYDFMSLVWKVVRALTLCSPPVPVSLLSGTQSSARRSTSRRIRTHDNKCG
jgi:hypothetical protein